MHIYVLGTILCGLRARSLRAVFLLGILLLGAAMLAGSFSARQPQTVVLDVGLSLLRFSLVLLAIFWIQELIAREIDRRTVIFALTYPYPRYYYLLGRYFGILLLLLIATLILSLLLGLGVVLTARNYEPLFSVSLGWAYWVTVFGVWLDVAVVTSFALWIASLSTVSILPLALGGAFAIGGRALGGVLQYLRSGADGDASLTATYLPLLNVFQWILPDLSRLDWRLWPMYGGFPGADTIGWACAMAFAYACMMLILAISSFKKREFQ